MSATKAKTKTEMRKNTLINNRDEETNDSHAAMQVARAATDFETSLGDGKGLKAIDYIRLLETQQDADVEQAVEISVRWSEECETTIET